MKQKIDDCNSIQRLIADIGGTNARFALLTPNSDIVKIEVLPCASYSGLVIAVQTYLQKIGSPKIREAAIAIANPLSGDYVKMTNNDWAFSIKESQQALRLDRLIFKNDFTALAMSVPYLQTNDYQQIGGTEAKINAPIAVLGPGTGLGVSGLVHSGEQWIPLEGEGGHVSLSPSNKREYAILDSCWQEFGHVSAERLISGLGLQNLYQAICRLENIPPQNLSPAEISTLALNHSDKNCIETLEIFCSMLGTVAGNLTLTLGATGGVYIGGGIIPKLGSYFNNSMFREKFESKGRMSQYIKKIPAYVIHAKHPALMGIGKAFSLT